MNICTRCGICCHFFDEKKVLRKCKHLVKMGAGLTVCRIFKKRIGAVIYHKEKLKLICIFRKDSKVDYENCPFNTDKPMFGKEDEKDV